MFEKTEQLCQSLTMTNDDSRRKELESIIRGLQEEVERLKAEIERLRGVADERPPHYL